LSPNRPHCAAGIRIEPPPSVACATGRPADTAAAAPPEEPPGEYSRIPRIVAGAVEPRLGIRVQAELRARAAAHEHEAGLLAARHVRGVVIGDKILEQAAAEGHPLTGLEEAKVLKKVRHALQRSFG